MTTDSSLNQTIKTGDELLILVEGDKFERVSAADFNHNYTVIIIHGFTAHGKYMVQTAQEFKKQGLNPIIFNYDSFKGIINAAKNLYNRLVNLDKLSIDTKISNIGIINDKGISLVAHSMGGLVSRAFCNLDEKKYVKSIVTLGTPHQGTLVDWISLKWALRAWQLKYNITTPGFNRSCQSAKELTCTDGNLGNTLIDKMQVEESYISTIPKLSISGGLQHLECYDFPFFNYVVNKYIQSKLKNKENDGLVTEYSSDWTKLTWKKDSIKPIHFNNYDEFKVVNHSNLHLNQDIALIITRWIYGHSPEISPKNQTLL
ncbi:esterase/lipase family protein [Thalassomonas actiniarum]|uniref:GPI inositol-deacylase PGAP1-like alpha/beta domain-containing protein n=1 Tax=Thalassomonas actiniarum TaxID=485447 RepID=A0AAF0BX78_9GAMM|nr:hypothetical protein [Thalassomonas actiniarum]WDD96951.1 hypothetical protein SG35_016475 [Thalassomonas actiniarum]